MQKINNSIAPLSFIWKMSKPYKFWFFCLCIGPIWSGFISVFANYTIKVVIDTVNGNIFSYSVFLKPMLMFLFAEVSTRIIWDLHDYSEYKIQGKLFKEILISPYEYLQNHSYKFFQNNFSGSLISKVKGVSDGVYNFWDKISHSLSYNVSSVIMNVLMIGFFCIKMIIPFSICFLIIGVCFYFQSKKIKEYASIDRKNWNTILGMVSDNITNIFTIFSFAKKQKEIKQIADFYDNVQIPLLNKSRFFNFISFSLLGGLFQIMIMLLFVYAIYLRKNNEITTGTLTAIILIINATMDSVNHLVRDLVSFVEKFADFKTSLEGIFLEQEILDKKDAKELII